MQNLKTKEEFFQFSNEKEKVFDEFYKSKKWECKRIVGKDNEDYDCLVKKDGIWYKIEEKFRSGEWDDLAVETIQDIETNSPGWLYYTKAQYLFYGMGKKIYAINIEKLRNFIKEYRNNFKIKYSKKGWGNTKFIIIPWYEIINNKIGKLLCKDMSEHILRIEC